MVAKLSIYCDNVVQNIVNFHSMVINNVASRALLTYALVVIYAFTPLAQQGIW